MEIADKPDSTVPAFDCAEAPSPPVPDATGCLRIDRPLDAQVRYLPSGAQTCAGLGYCLVELFNRED
jgi:hypothetical protein